MQSKLLAEVEVLEASKREKNLATCALRPHGIFGPRDPNLLPALARGTLSLSIYVLF